MKQSPSRQAFRHLSARPAGRAYNPRARAGSGSVANTTGIRAAGEPSPVFNHFGNTHVPALWAALVPEFGRQVQFQIGGVPSETYTITVIWKEGAEDEDASPGRYSHMLVINADLPQPPRLGDLVLFGDFTYAVVRVDAYPYGVSNLVLHEESEGL